MNTDQIDKLKSFYRVFLEVFLFALGFVVFLAIAVLSALFISPWIGTGVVVIGISAFAAWASVYYKDKR